MALIPFNGVQPLAILNALYRDCSPEDVVSVQFRCPAPPSRSEIDHWLRLQYILSAPEVYAAFGISSLPGHADFGRARGLEVIGTLANLLNHGGVHANLVNSYDEALTMARKYLDEWFLRNYTGAEAYSCHEKWNPWFVGEGILDETVLIGNGDEWWLLAVTGMD